MCGSYVRSHESHSTRELLEHTRDSWRETRDHEPLPSCRYLRKDVGKDERGAALRDAIEGGACRERACSDGFYESIFLSSDPAYINVCASFHV